MNRPSQFRVTAIVTAAFAARGRRGRHRLDRIRRRPGPTAGRDHRDRDRPRARGLRKPRRRSRPHRHRQDVVRRPRRDHRSPARRRHGRAFKTALGSADGLEAFGLADFYGGINTIPADTAWSLTTTLDSGHYVVLDHGAGPDGPDGPAWFTDDNFFHAFDVSATHVDAPRPPATASVDLTDFAFTDFRRTCRRTVSCAHERRNAASRDRPRQVEPGHHRRGRTPGAGRRCR